MFEFTPRETQTDWNWCVCVLLAFESCLNGLQIYLKHLPLSNSTTSHTNTRTHIYAVNCLLLHVYLTIKIIIFHWFSPDCHLISLSIFSATFSFSFFSLIYKLPFHFISSMFCMRKHKLANINTSTKIGNVVGILCNKHTSEQSHKTNSKQRLLSESVLMELKSRWNWSIFHWIHTHQTTQESIFHTHHTMFGFHYRLPSHLLLLLSIFHSLCVK